MIHFEIQKKKFLFLTSLCVCFKKQINVNFGLQKFSGVDPQKGSDTVPLPKS